jgi:hypothetical protein
MLSFVPTRMLSLYCRDLTQSESRSLTWATKNGVEGYSTGNRGSSYSKSQSAPEKFSSSNLRCHKVGWGHVPIVELLLKVHNNIDLNYVLGAETGVDSLIIQWRADLVCQDVNPIPNALQFAALQGH